MAQIGFSKLSPTTRCFALVGFYLQHWSLMEGQLNQALGKALGLKGLQEAIVCHNIQLRDKLHILKTAVHIERYLNSEKKEEFTNLIEDVRNASYERNMVAHDIFGPNSQNTGVEWIVIKAKGKLKFPKPNWDTAMFVQKCKLLDTYTTLSDGKRCQEKRRHPNESQLA